MPRLCRRTTRTFVGSSLQVALLIVAGCTCPTQPKDSRNTSLYIDGVDGTQIAIDVWLPPGTGASAKVPTVIRLTRYWRAWGVIPPTQAEPLAEPFMSAGYAYVTVDVRGSGVSFGVSRAPWSPEEMADYGSVVDWVVAQPWSDGKVAAYGVSYDGNTAALVSTLDRPAVKAVVPQFFDLDAFSSPAMPGGVLDDYFIREWSAGNRASDLNDACAMAELAGIPCAIYRLQGFGPKPVDADECGDLREQAFDEHAANVDPYAALLNVDYIDDAWASTDLKVIDLGLFRRAAEIDRGNIPWFTWASWQDAGVAASALSAFLTFKNPQQVIIGSWSHGGGFDADPLNAADAPTGPTPEQQFFRMVAFLDEHVKGGAAVTRKIEYYTQGEGAWRTTGVWPPADVKTETWYFGSNHTLSTTAPSADDSDIYAVDYTATTGASNRWHTQLDGADVVYPDRAAEDAKLLTYTSAPLAADTRVTGSPVVTLHVSASREDAALYAYLEDVAPDGRVTLITEGVLRALHRKVSTQEPAYFQLGPHHSFLRADGEPLVAGTPVEIAFSLQPTSTMFRAGHAIRVAIAGHDADTFERLPATGNTQFTVFRSPTAASRIDLPIATAP